MSALQTFVLSREDALYKQSSGLCVDLRTKLTDSKQGLSDEKMIQDLFLSKIGPLIISSNKAKSPEPEFLMNKEDVKNCCNPHNTHFNLIFDDSIVSEEVLSGILHVVAINIYTCAVLFYFNTSLIIPSYVVGLEDVEVMAAV